MNVNPERIIKLLNLTASNNDHEALSAVRIANKILAGERKTWTDLFASRVVIREPARPAEPRPPKKPRTRKPPKTRLSADQMFKALEHCRVSPGTRTFLNSLKVYNFTNGGLTRKQRLVLEEIYEEHCNK